MDLKAEHLTLPAGMQWARWLLRYTEQAERELARRDTAGHLQAHFASPGRRKLVFTLFMRLVGVASPTMEDLITQKLARMSPLLALNSKLATSAQHEEAAAELTDELRAAKDPFAEGGPLAHVPLLAEVLDHLSAQFVDMALELAERLAQDRADIAPELFCGQDFGPIGDVTADGSDAHFHGRFTCMLHAAGKRFLYKPHDCRVDAFFGDIARRWFADSLIVPRALARDGYGWCAFIEGAPVIDEGEVRAYFRRLGRAFALFQALGSCDLHAENWIACGGMPALIDLETILSPRPRIFNDPAVHPDAGGPEAGILYDLNRSLVQSSLLPHFSDERQLCVLLDNSPASRCLPVLDGRPRTVLGYEDELFAGFAEGYKRCLDARADLRAAVEACRGVAVRKLLRNTNYYANIQRKLYAPRALASHDAQGRILNRLASYFERHGAMHLVPIARWEARCLLDGDIPYFCAASDGHDLCGHACGPDNAIAPDFFEHSAVEEALERTGRLSEAERDFETGILHEALAMALMHADEPETRPDTQPEPNALSRQDAYDAAVEILADIDRRLLTGPSGQQGWLMRSEDQTGVSYARPALSQGTAGLGIFFAALAKLAPNGSPERKRALALADIVLSQVDQTVEALERARTIPEEAIQLGVTSGAGGVLVALAHMERALGDGRARGLALRIARVSERMQIEQAKHADVFAGLAGLMLGLAADRVVTEDHASRAAMARAARRLLDLRTLSGPNDTLLWDTLDLGRAVSGLGHGVAGIALALHRAAELDRTLDTPELREAVRAALAFEHGAYSEKLSTWLDYRSSAVPDTAMHGICSGAPGIGLALLSMGDKNPHAHEGLQRAIRTCLTRPRLYRDHLCCGNAATVDFLLEVARASADPAEARACRERAADLLCASHAAGWRLLPPMYRDTPDTSLFYGLAGVGYELLRLIDPELGSVIS